jgi:hypothetical protein
LHLAIVKESKKIQQFLGWKSGKMLSFFSFVICSLWRNVCRRCGLWHTRGERGRDLAGNRNPPFPTLDK